MASRLQLMLKGKWFLTPPIHMNHTRLMTALMQSCSFLHHVLLEVRLKPYNLTSGASNIYFSREVSNPLNNTFFVSAVVRQIMKGWPIPYTVVLIVLGLCFGAISGAVPELQK